MDKVQIGKVTHYFSKLGVAVVEVSSKMRVGDSIIIEGSETGPVQQKVESMQIDHKEVSEAMPGQSIGMRVSGKVHPGNQVYKIS